MKSFDCGLLASFGSLVAPVLHRRRERRDHVIYHQPRQLTVREGKRSQAGAEDALNLPAKGGRPSGSSATTSTRAWGLSELAVQYPRLSIDRETGDAHNLESVTPVHPFGTDESGEDAVAKGAGFRSLAHDELARLDFMPCARWDRLGQLIHDSLLAIELRLGSTPRSRDPGMLADKNPAPAVNGLPAVARLAEETAWLTGRALVHFVA